MSKYPPNSSFRNGLLSRARSYAEVIDRVVFCSIQNHGENPRILDYWEINTLIYEYFCIRIYPDTAHIKDPEIGGNLTLKHRTFYVQKVHAVPATKRGEDSRMEGWFARQGSCPSAF